MSNPTTISVACPECGCPGGGSLNCCSGLFDDGPFSVALNFSECQTIFAYHYGSSECYGGSQFGKKLCWRVNAADANDVYDVPRRYPPNNPTPTCAAELVVPQKIRAYGKIVPWLVGDPEPPDEFPTFECQSKLDLRISLLYGISAMNGTEENPNTAGGVVVVDTFTNDTLPIKCKPSGALCDVSWRVQLACAGLKLGPTVPKPPCRNTMNIVVPGSCCPRTNIPSCKTCGQLLVPPQIAQGPYWNGGGNIILVSPP